MERASQGGDEQALAAAMLDGLEFGVGEIREQVLVCSIHLTKKIAARPLRKKGYVLQLLLQLAFSVERRGAEDKEEDTGQQHKKLRR